MVSVVNQWANSVGQGTAFTTLTPALQSCVVQLTNTFSVGGGSGTPTAGNWLFVIASWTQDPALAEVHVGVSDDGRDYWRQFPASSISGNTRTTIAYTCNIGSPSVPLPSYVYVAPDGQLAALTVLIVEVSGLGPWDTVGSGYPVSNYAAAATSLSLSGGAPGAASFFIAAAGGDSTAATQAFAPGGWTTLHTVSQSDGSDQLASSYLTSAYLASSSSAQSVSATAGSATDLSGFMIAVRTTGASPVPAGQNPNWPYMKFEAAFGSGYNTPVSEMTWTDLTSRAWDWDGQGGIQFQLGQLQSAQYTITLDNFDAYLTSTNSASPYYPYVQPGTPVRIRAALGVIGGVTVNRWYTLALNAGEWTEKIGGDFRRYAELSATDLWASLSATPPTFYRAEIYQDSPYAWWPCDDQPGTAGILPTALLNAAPGNTNTLNVVLSPNGGTVQNYLTESGINTNVATQGNSSGFPPGVAVYTAGADGGWMFGDPQSSPSSVSAAGNPVQSTPGSAAWQASGQAGSTGSYGWFLSCNDAGFPPLSGGITIEAWFNAAYYGSANMWVVIPSSGTGTVSPVTSQPQSTNLTIWEIATGSNPVCLLYLDSSGHLILETFNGASGTTHSIYTSSDLRSGSWHMVTVELTATAWQVWLDGGENANVSGSATGMTSAWTWFAANGDFGANGGSSAGTGLVHGGNIALSHIAVYPARLPYYRVLGHYWAAISAFGQLPAPTAVQVQWLEQPANATFAIGSHLASGIDAPDGTPAGITIGNTFTGYGYGASTGVSVSAVVAATASASITSGPSAWVASAVNYTAPNGSGGGGTSGVALWISWTGVAPGFNLYTSANLGAETEAAVVCGTGDSFSSGYGSGASGHGVAQTASGSGASPPASPTAAGDTVQQRIERLMYAGKGTSASRSIDPAALPVQAPGTSGGGLQCGAAIQQIQQSDSGMLYVDTQNNLVYWQRPHLAAQYSSPVWQLGPDAGKIPYWRDAGWPTDPQRIINAITIQPVSPTGAALPEYTPTNASGVESSQELYGAQPYSVTSWLQSTSEMQSQANWLFSNWGVPQRRAENIKIDAAAYPAAWPLVLGASVGDVVTIQDWMIGGGGPVYTYRVTELRRHLEFGGPGGREVTAAVVLTLDWEPSSYWT